MPITAERTLALAQTARAAMDALETVRQFVRTQRNEVAQGTLDPIMALALIDETIAHLMPQPSAVALVLAEIHHFTHNQRRREWKRIKAQAKRDAKRGDPPQRSGSALGLTVSHPESKP